MTASLALALAFLPSFARSQERTDRSNDPRILEPEAFRSKASSGSRVPVIVNLSVAPQIRSFRTWQDPMRAARHRDSIASEQLAVLDKLPKDEFELRHRLENQATFTGSITSRGLAILLDEPAVESIEVDHEVPMNTDQGITLMNAEVARGRFDGGGISIAISDTGIDYNHPALGNGGFPNGKVIGGRDFGDGDDDPLDQNGHGTSVAGIAAGDVIVDGDYVGGVAPGASVYALKIVSGGSSTASLGTILASWDWCVTHQNDEPARPILVINTSFGGFQIGSTCNGAFPALATAASNAVAAGITLFCSAGNDGFCTAINVPACIAEVASVGAVYDAALGQRGGCISQASCIGSSSGCSSGWACSDITTSADQVTCYSNSAPFLRLLAPADSARVPRIGGGFWAFGRTSAASPYAAGAAAVLICAARSSGVILTPADVRDTLIATGDAVTDAKSSITTPRVNLGNAIETIGTWVDFAYAGLEDGTFFRPFNTLAEGVAAVPVGGKVLIRSGAASETLTISKALVLNAVGGLATIGM